MRIIDGSSDVCSSDRDVGQRPAVAAEIGPASQSRFESGQQRQARRAMFYRIGGMTFRIFVAVEVVLERSVILRNHRNIVTVQPIFRIMTAQSDRKRVVLGKSVSVRVDLGGSRR